MSFQEFVKDAKTKVRDEAARSTAGIRAYAQSFVTSRVSMALAMALFISFASTAVYAPDRLPPIAAPGLIAAGIIAPPPALDLSDFNIADTDVRGQAADAVAAAKPYLQQAYERAGAALPHLPLYLDVVGAALSLLALLYTGKLQLRAARVSTRSLAL
jgi:hypothetical protein